MDVWRLAPIVLVAIGGSVDVRTRRIPNVLTFTGAAAGIGYHAWVDGLAGAGHALGGWAAGVALFLPLFLLRGMGGGDVKLLGAVGAWVGPGMVVRAALYTTIAGAILALAVGAWHGYLAKALRNVWGILLFWRVAGIRPVPGVTLQDGTGPRLPYGVAIAAGTLAAVWLT